MIVLVLSLLAGQLLNEEPNAANDSMKSQVSAHFIRKM